MHPTLMTVGLKRMFFLVCTM